MKKILGIFSHPVLRSSAIMFVGNMAANVMAFLYHLIIGRILGKEQYGELAAILALFYILNVPTAVLQTILVKFFSKFKAENAYGKSKHLFLSVTRVLVALSGIGAIVTIIAAPLLTRFLHLNSPWYVYWLYIIFIFTLIGMINMSVLQSYQLFFSLSLIVVASALLRLILGITFAPGGVGMTLFSAVIAAGAGYALLFIPLKFLFRYKSQASSVSKSEAVGYSVPTTLALLGLTLLYSQDVLWVKHFFSAPEAGVYSAISVLGKIIYFASSSIIIVAFPTLVERKALKKTYTSIVWISLAAVAAISLLITAGYFILPGLVVNLLFGAAYLQAGKYLGLFGLFISFYSLVSLLTNVSLALGRTRVWILTCIASLFQIGGIAFYHTSLLSVMYVNLGVTVALFVLLLLYYRYAEQKT